jgi:hypothetical protein
LCGGDSRRPKDGNDGFVIAKLTALLIAIAGSAILQPRLQGFAAVDAVQCQVQARFLKLSLL